MTDNHMNGVLKVFSQIQDVVFFGAKWQRRQLYKLARYDSELIAKALDTLQEKSLPLRKCGFVQCDIIQNPHPRVKRSVSF